MLSGQIMQRIWTILASFCKWIMWRIFICLVDRLCSVNSNNSRLFLLLNFFFALLLLYLKSILVVYTVLVWKWLVHGVVVWRWCESDQGGFQRAEWAELIILFFSWFRHMCSIQLHILNIYMEVWLHFSWAGYQPVHTKRRNQWKGAAFWARRLCHKCDTQ